MAVYGSRLMAKEKSTFQILSLLLSSFISNIYTPEKGYYWQNQPNGLKGKGVSRSQLQCQATTALRKNSVHLNLARSQLQCQATTALRKNSVHLNLARGRVIEINVCERLIGKVTSMTSESYLDFSQDINRTPKRPK